MAKGIELASAYLTLVPSLRGAQKSITSQLEGIDVTKSGRKLGASLGDSMGKSAGERLSNQLIKSGSALQGFGKSLADVGGKLTASITLPLVSATTAVGGFALATASAAETSEISFTTMLGSAEAAEQMMADLADFAARTPFELSGLQDATRQLLAYGFAADDIIPMLTAVGDATAALGTGQRGIESVTRALGQMQAKQKVSSEEMLQLTEQGIPAWEYLAEAIGTDTAGAMEMVSDGAVTASEGISALREGMERDFGGMMEDQSKTLAGLASNLFDAIEQPFMKLKDTEAYERLAESFEDVVDAAGPFVESLLPHLEDGIEAVADVLDVAADAMEDFSDMSESSQRNLISMVAAAAAAGPALTVAGKGIQFLGIATKGAGTAIKAGSDLLGKLSDKLLDVATPPETASGALGKLSTALLAIPTPAKVAATAVGVTLVAAVSAFAIEAEEARRHEELLSSATASTSDIMSGAAGAADGFGDAIGGIATDAQGTLEALRDLNESVSDTLSEVQADSHVLDQYVGVIDELANKSGLSATEQYRLSEAIEGYNDIVGTQYSLVDAANGAIADQNGVIQGNTDQINANAKAWQNRAYAQALSDVAADYLAAEADASYQLQVAQENLNEAYRRRSELLDIVDGKTGASTGEITEAAMEVDRLNREIPGLESQVTDLGAAYDSASEKADGFSAAAAIQTAVFGALGDKSDEFVSSLSQTGIEMDAFASLGDEQLANLAASWDGTSDSIIRCLDEMGVSLESYNAVPILNKDGTVTIDDALLTDAQKNVYTWNGTTLVDKDGVAVVDDIELTDAQKNVWVWNGSELRPQRTTATVGGNLAASLSMMDAWNRGYLAQHYGLASIKQVYTTIHDPGRSYNAAGGIRLNAEGGIRYHADGAIATKAVPLDIVGEDGAEAIVPLTNRKYSQPFADVIAEGVARRMGAGDTNIYYIGDIKVAMEDEEFASAFRRLMTKYGQLAKG